MDASRDKLLLQMPRRSRYAGQTVDTTSRRSIEIQSGHAGRPTIDVGDRLVEVDHFYHEGTFWRAVIPLDGVQDVFGQAFNFSRPRTRRGARGREIVFNRHGLPKRVNPILNHLQSRFVLQPGQDVALYPLGAATSGTPACRLRDLVYTVEAVGPPGVSYNLRDALLGNLLSAHRWLSATEMVFERIVVENQYVTESPALPLSAAQKRKLLVASLLRSHKAGMSEIYYLYRPCGTNNCTSSPFQLLDEVADYSLAQRIGSMLYRLPLNPRFYLKVRGMDADSSVRSLVREEFDDYIADATTRQRRATYVRQKKQARRSAQDAHVRDKS